MKRILPLIALTGLIFCSCKKVVDQQKQNIVMSAITNGVWLVDQYVENSTDITTDFSGYEFQFSSNGTVTGTKSGVSVTGTWSGNVDNYSITSNFPTAGDPVKKLNGVWAIKDSYWDYVVADMTTTAGTNILHLIKKP